MHRKKKAVYKKKPNHHKQQQNLPNSRRYRPVRYPFAPLQRAPKEAAILVLNGIVEDISHPLPSATAVGPTNQPKGFSQKFGTECL